MCICMHMHMHMCTCMLGELASPPLGVPQVWQWVGARNEAEARACVLSRLRRRVGLVVVREMARHRLRRVPYIGVPRHIVEERMQPFHLRAIERGGGAAVSAADFYAFQQRQGAWGRDAA